MIDCKTTSELLPDFLAEQLGEGDRAAILEHINGCVACSDLASLWGHLGDLQDEAPSDMLRQRFNTMLRGYQLASETAAARPRRAPFWQWSRLAWPALAAACLVLGLFVGRTTSPAAPRDRQLAELQSEIHQTRQLVALSLLQQQSASERLRGINWTQQLEPPDPQVAAALLHALKFDSSVDVRLAAVDALRRYRTQPEVRDALVGTLSGRQSPLVQISVIDLLVDSRDPAAPRVLETLRSDPSANAAVKQHASWALQQF